MESINKESNSPVEELGRPIPFLVRALPRILASQRYLAYTSEVGESFRPLVPFKLVQASYVASLAYVGADIVHNYHEDKANGLSGRALNVKIADRFVWHSFASMILPALSIHTIVDYSSRGIKKFDLFRELPKCRQWGPTALALFSIPLIIHPLDHFTDFAMDNTLRKFYSQT